MLKITTKSRVNFDIAAQTVAVENSSAVNRSNIMTH